MFEFFITTYGNKLITYGNKLIGFSLLALFGCLGYAAKKICKAYLDDDTKRSIAMTAVRFVEQVWKDIHGADKLRKALETAEDLLKKKGIPFDADEMMVLIEAAVQEMNEVFQKTEKQQLPTSRPGIMSAPSALGTRNNPA